MKQFKSYSGVAAVCTMLMFASCGNDIELTEAQTPVKGEYKVTFTASQESSATRTAVDGVNVVWQAGDAITVFDGAGENCIFEFARYAVIDEQEVKTIGEFEGTITVTEPKKYSAVYPATEEAQITTGDALANAGAISPNDVDQSAIYITNLYLPTVQEATTGSFDPQAAIMIARNDDASGIEDTEKDLTLGEFRHVCAFVKVTTTEPYDKITFTANGGDSIVGGFAVKVGTDGIPHAIPTSPSCTVSLVPPTGSTKIAAGTYLIAVLPGTLAEGFTMSCSSIDKETSTVTTMARSFSNPTNVFSRCNVVNMGTVEEGATAAAWTKETHQYVDLGLDSGTKWATCNVGATSPEGYGYYFAWGETSTKDDYTSATYKWYDTNNNNSMTRYNATDGKTILDACDDAAHINWGGAWRMPTEGEQLELFRKCYWEWTEDYGGTNSDNPIKGFIVYKAKHPDDKGKMKYKDSNTTAQETYNSSTDAHIFLPATGINNDYFILGAGLFGYYWSASLDVINPGHAYSLYFDWVTMFSNDNEFCSGLSVRPVLQD